jgi:hypothetical protein
VERKRRRRRRRNEAERGESSPFHAALHARPHSDGAHDEATLSGGHQARPLQRPMDAADQWQGRWLRALYELIVSIQHNDVVVFLIRTMSNEDDLQPSMALMSLSALHSRLSISKACGCGCRVSLKINRDGHLSVTANLLSLPSHSRRIHSPLAPSAPTASPPHLVTVTVCCCLGGEGPRILYAKYRNTANVAAP